MAKTTAAPPPAKTPAPRPAEYTVVARRYRPQQLADLIGQDHVAKALANAITSGRIAHAYLFTGARGVGKTSAARILAKCLNCVTGPTPTPCDACDVCKSVAAGEDVDVPEIDGASNNKVDEIRDLKSNVGFRPTRARYKIYIIDEVHMLSTSAFNALLKTLEEPPPHVKFIFATTEVQKIPITILSRCQRFDFAHVGPQKIFQQLKFIVGKEGLKADDESLHLIARRAAGSMRDSQSLLDQLLAFSDGTLTAESIYTLLGTAGDDRVAELADAILRNDAGAAVETIAGFADRGLQLAELLDQLIDYWRGMMLALAGGSTFRELGGTPAFQERIRGHAAGTNLDTVLAGLDVLTAAKAKARGSTHVQVLLEMAVVRLSRMEELLSVASLAKYVANPGAAPAPATPGAKATVRPPEAAPPKKKSPAGPDNPTPGGPAGNNPGATAPPENFAEVWAATRDALGGVTGKYLGMAEHPAIVAPNSLVIRFPARYSSAYDYCAADRTLAQIRAALKKVTAAEWLVRVDLDHTVVAEETTRQPVDGKKDVMQLPLIKKAVDALGAQLLKIDEGFNPVRPAAPVVPPGEFLADSDER